MTKKQAMTILKARLEAKNATKVVDTDNSEYVIKDVETFEPLQKVMLTSYHIVNAETNEVVAKSHTIREALLVLHFWNNKSK